MTIGIFGGSFNPIHNGHIAIARQALAQTDMDEVWFVVSPHNPFKSRGDLMDDDLRLDMVRKALEGEKNMVCSDYEFRLPRPSYMWNTLKSLARDYPRDKFVLLIGADNWTSFPRWRESGKIMASHEVVVYPRRGHEIDKDSLPPGVTLLDLPLYDISATEIRRRIAAGREAGDLTSDAVIGMMSGRDGNKKLTQQPK